MFLNPLVKPALRIRLITVVSVCALFSQIVFIGLVRKADAKAKAPVADTSSPAEPFIVNTPPTFATGLASLLGFLAPTAKKESPKTEEGATEPPSPATAQPAPFMSSATAAEFAALRLQPGNATGGTDLYSRNFGWGTSLVGLPGRAGMDAGFGISYNSLVWLKDTTNSEIIFDPDLSNVSPGFQMGLPEIEKIYNTGGDNYSFLMVNPDGSRTEFRRIGMTTTFEPGDSSYRQLVISSGGVTSKAANIELTVTSTDGTMMHYLWKSHVSKYECEEIKDRNGNIISIGYTSGRLTSMEDTLGRVVTINRDGGGYPTTIQQTWKDANGSGSNTTHTWATFSYTNATVSTSFSGLTVIGPANSTTVKVLEKITYPDSSFTKFEYNSYVQVKKISQVAADSTSMAPHVLNYVTTDLASVSGSQTDCPRFGETKTWVENFNGGSEVVVTNSLTTGATYSLPNSITGSATRIDVAMTGHPDGLYSRTYVGASGYKEGLTLATEDCTGSNCATRLRWTWNDWTQDNTGVSYITNPRVIESRVGDGTNIKKTTVGYGSNSYGLPEEVKVYDTDLSTVLKTQTTTYELGSTYTNRRIIGLPSETKLWQGTTSGTLMSKVTYAYDLDDDFAVSGMGQNNTGAVQHDDTNYSATFSAGRGNLTSVKRWDATDPTDSADAVTSTILYNITGAVVAKTDPLSHTVKIAYTDDFNASGMPTTYAYPTTITDQNNQSSTIKYRYDIGANVEATSPAPAGQTYGKTSKRLFDSIGRLDRQSVYVNTTEKAYTRYEYPTNGVQSVSYTPIVDADGDSNIAEDEVLNESWFDGAGRVRRSRTEHPGSTGGWTATQTEYDILGRTYRTSVPTEVSVSGSTWTAAGDDSTRGWIWNYQEYDWKGRVKRTIPSDSTGSDGKDTLISYAGCGCAGGQVTTIEGPSVPRTDTSGDARRKQKVYEDILGRNFKTESFEWDGSTVYSTLVNTFNGRDQVTNSRLYSGTTSSTTYQDTTMTYDGHARLKTKHIPQQDAEKETVYYYNTDDTVASVVDAREKVTAYFYNSRKLVTQVGYAHALNVPTEIETEFTYDNVGNRTSMTDLYGNTSYVYDSLSRLTSETRQFTDDLPYAPQANDSFQIGYSYNLSGQLRSITEPYGVTVNYTQDKVGRLTTVAPSTSFGGVSTFASNGLYRAWGALKHIEYSNGVEMDQTFDNGLRASTYGLATSTVNVMDKSYEYNKDGSLKLVEDNLNWKFDRSYTYDHQTRLKDGKSSTEATGTEITGGAQVTDLPYRQTHTFNAFGNLTQRYNKQWGGDGNQPMTYTYSNGRVTSSSNGYTTWTSWAHDADGRVTASPGLENATITYDATGRISEKHDKAEPNVYEDKITRYYDGDSRETKRIKDRCRVILPEEPEDPCTWQGEEVRYYIRSTVLGGEVISEAVATGHAYKRYIFAGGTKFGELTHRYGEPIVSGTYTQYDAVQYYHNDPAGVSQRISRNYPEGLLGESSIDPGFIDPRHAEFDAGGGNVGTVTNWTPGPSPPSDPPIPIEGESPLFINGQQVSATLDGMSVGWQTIQAMALGGAVTHGGHPVDLVGGTLWLATSTRFRFNPKWEMPNEMWMPNGAGSWSIVSMNQTRTGPKIGPGVPVNILKLVTDLAERSACADILNKFKDELGKKNKLDDIEKDKSFIESVFNNLKEIVIDPPNAGSGAKTNGDYIKLNDYLRFPKANQNALYAKYVLQELVHNFKRGNNIFSDEYLSNTANKILDSMDKVTAEKFRADFKATGHKEKDNLHHFLLNQFCNYTQQEVDNGQPQ